MPSEFGKRSSPAESKLQKERTLEFIIKYIKQHGYAPSYQEIAKSVGTPRSQAYKFVTALAARGDIKVTPGIARSIVLA